MTKFVPRFPSSDMLSACIFALLCLSSVGYASQPSAENNVHFCLPFNLEDMRARDSIYAATKHALNLNVGAPRTVRMIYFLPNDRPFRQEVVDSMKVTIRQIQTFYAEQMEARGHGRKTFRFETDARGEPLVHRVDGQYPDSQYLENTTATVLDEIRQNFDTQANNVYLVVIDNSIDAIGIGNGRRAGGVGGGGRNNGSALVPGRFHWTTAAHELGHAFGLSHDFNDSAYIMSYGSGQDRLSACHAEFLSVHPYFNPDIPDKATPIPKIALTSPSVYPAGSKSVSVQLRVSDSDGLHQVILFVRTREPHPAGGAFEVKECRGLEGVRDAGVEFDYDGVIPSDISSNFWEPNTHPISVEAVDTEGNVEYKYFELSCENCPQTLVKISGDNQQGPLGVALANPFRVEVKDQNRNVIEGVPVTFTVTAGNGRLGGRFTVEHATTDANGTARSILTLGPNTGTNIVEVTVPGLDPVIFNATGVGTPPSMAGDYQTWSLPNGTVVRLGKGTVSQGDQAVAFSPDDQYLAVASSIGIWLYDVATSRELALLGHTVEVSAVVFSPNSTMLVSGLRDGTIKLWDIATRRNIATLEEHKSWVNSVAFSPNGTTLASAGGGTVKLWDMAMQTNIVTLQDSGPVAFSPNGTMLALGSRDNTIKLWNVAMQTNIATLQGSGPVAFSPDGTVLAVGSGSSEIKLWDIAMQTNTATLRHTLVANSVAFSPDGTTLAVGSWREIKLWDIATLTNIASLEGHMRSVNSVAFSSDGTILASAGSLGDNTIKLWDRATHNITTLEGHTHLVRSVAFSPDGTTLAVGSNDRAVKLWDIGTGRNIASLEGHKHSVNSVAFSPGGTTLASGSNDNTIKLWDRTKKQHLATLMHTHLVESVAFSPDGSTLASGAWGGNSSADAGTVWLWDVSARRHLTTLEGHAGAVRSVAFSPDGTILASGAEDYASGSYDGMVKLWDMATRRNIATLEGHKSWVNSVAFSPDGTVLASGSSNGFNTVKLWNMATKENIATLWHTDGVRSVAFSPNGSTVASGVEDGTVRLWDVATKENIAMLEGHTDRVFSVAFSPDGTILASGATDGTVLLWDMSELGLGGMSQDIFSLSLDGDGAAGDQAVTNLDVSPGEIVSLQVFGKDIQGAEGFSIRFEYDETQVLYEGFDSGGVLPNAQVLSSPGTNPTAIEIWIASFGGKAVADSGLVGRIRFRTTSTFSGTTLRLMRAELGRGEERERITFDNTSVTLQLAALTPDFNGDGRVDLDDFLLFVEHLGFSRGDEGYDAKYDLDEDGVIGFGDFLIFANAFGEEGA